MPESVQANKALLCFGGFLFWTLAGAVGLYTATTLVVLTAGFVSLGTGWYPFTIESGP